ncbi:hypothetical protein FRX31_004597 [Thalictrum thalictroides]|uniref:Pectinesterase inhibitor domain-containing protein n=1 Tax=Thalictrum thalictroides TaxID=46969 RepID=A0A7J6X7P6_THATH|nr:hypothetical protein FRX31_004597 [Thalictrum thalictroides]
MAFHALNLAFVLLICLIVASTSLDVLDTKYLTVPSSVFLSSINSTIENVSVAQTLTVSMFADKAKDYGMSNKIIDCIELLNDTMDDLSMSQSVIQNLHGK